MHSRIPHAGKGSSMFDRLRSLVPVIFLSLAPVSQGADAPIPASLLRTALIVEDVDRSLAFYALLGFHAVDEMAGPRDPDTTRFPLEGRSRHSRLLILESAAGGGGRIGLVGFSDPQPALGHAGGRNVGRGDVVLVMDVADADAVHARLLAARARIVEPPQQFRSRMLDASGQPLVGKVFHVFDPDGNLIELLQAAKVAK
jgi:catechol 2,3-dioxygenase-like lactoylglutathione lyase family enzyme